MSQRPNILLMMTDQQRFDTIAAAGYPHMITPNLDRLVGEGCLYRSAYTPCPICVPARHHLLTGTTGRYHGFYTNAGDPPDPAIPTIPRLLADAGYETRAIGKMHFKPVRRHHGFDRMELSEEHPYYREADEYAMYLKSVGLGHIQNIHGIRNLLYEAPQRSLVPEEHHGTKWVGDRTIDFLETNRGRHPFFCWSSWIAPHPPFDLPPSVADLYRDRDLPTPIEDVTERNEFTRVMDHEDLMLAPPGRKEAFIRRRQEAYYAQVTFVDQQIGRIYDALKRTGLLDNTLIIFVSDHGEMLADHGSIQKAQAYESSTRIPFIVRYPKAFDPGTVSDEFVDLHDVMPTILDVAGVEHPKPELLPGGSLLREDKDRSTLHMGLGDGQRRWATLRDQRYKYTYYYALEHEDLFDMQADPDETTNLMDTQPDDPQIKAVRDRLHALLTEQEKRWGPPDVIDEDGRMKRLPPPDHGDRDIARMRSHQFPHYPNEVMDPAERAKITPFAEEALEAIRDEPVSKLSHFDLSSWRDHGATDDFIDRVRREDL